MNPSRRRLHTQFEDIAGIDVACPYSDAAKDLSAEDEERMLAVALRNMEHLDPVKRAIVNACLNPDSQETKKLAKQLGLTIDQLNEAIENIGEELRGMAKSCRLPDRAAPTPPRPPQPPAWLPPFPEKELRIMVSKLG